MLVSNDLSYDQRMQRIAGSLVRHGYEVELIGRVRKSSIPLATKAYGQKRLRVFFKKGPLFYVALNFRFFIYLLFHRSDLLWAADADTLPAARLASILTGTPFLYDAHEFFTEVPELQGRRTVQKIWRWIEDRCVPEAEACVTVSHGVAEMYKERYNRPFEVLRNLPRSSNPAVGSPKAERLIIYQGALNEGRGLEMLIRAMQNVNAKLLLAGEGDLSDELRKEVRKWSLEDKVKFAGYVEPSELNRLTSQAIVGVNLLENKGSSYYHSLANKFFSYVHAGIPQLCIDFPEYRKLNTEHEVALLIPDCDPGKIAAKLNSLLHDSSLYHRLQANCAMAKKEWNWEREEKKLLQLMESMETGR